MTDDLADLIAQYPDLGPDDRAAVDARVRAEHPGGLPEHADAQRLAALLDRTRTPLNRADRALDAAFGSGDLADVDANDRAALEALLPADPLAHFRALDAKVRAEHPDPFLSPASPPVVAAEEPKARAADRTSVPRARATRAVWARPYALVAMLAVLVVGSVAVWRGMQPPLGDFTAQELSVEGYGPVRSDAPGLSSDQQYLLALEDVRGAKTRTLGLFPRYDAAKLASAKTRLEAVTQDEAAGDFLRLEAFYALGKVHLLLGDRDAATDALRQVVLGEGAHAQDAEALLRTMHGGTPG